MGELAGLRVLVVEDEAGVALLIEDMLAALGCEIAASVANLAAARKLARSAIFDLAVLDVNLDGELAFPVAEVLESRQLPFIISTGYGQAGLPEAFRDRPVLSKPFTMENLRQTLLLALGR